MIGSTQIATSARRDKGTRPYRIRHVIDSLGRGGAERLLCAYAPALAKLGYEVDVVVLQERNGNFVRRSLEDAGIRVTLAPVSKLRRLDQIRALHIALKQGAPDLLHLHLEFASILGALSAARTRTAVVATLHTLESPFDLGWDGLRRWLMYQTCTLLSDRVICLTDKNAEIARKIGLGRARIAVLPNGVEVEKFDTPPDRDRHAIRAAFGIPMDAPLVVSVCVLRPEKGLDGLIAAVPAILQRVPDAHVLIVGDGPEMQGLQRCVAEACLTRRVHFAGYQTDVADILRAADVFTLPTLFDAQPTVIMEAMAAGLPVVATTITGIPDLIDDGVHGVLVPPNDIPALAGALIGCLEKPAWAQSLGRAGRVRVRSEFSMTQQIDKLAQLYESLMFARENRP
jgi:glycosyltransferase involved in cell wall biosynthesis